MARLKLILLDKILINFNEGRWPFFLINFIDNCINLAAKFIMNFIFTLYFDVYLLILLF